MPFLVAFIVVPIAIYGPNQLEFEHELTPIYAHVFLGMLALLPMLGLAFLGPRARFNVASALFFFGVFLLVSDIALPLQWGEFNGDERLAEPLHLTLLQAALAVSLVVLWYLLPSKAVRAVGVPLIFAVLAVQVYELGRASLDANANAVAAEPSKPDQETSEKRPNIYHFVFDAYSSVVFLDNLDKLGLRDDLGGFTYFPRNLSNYPATSASVPSFMSGRLFVDGSFKRFGNDARVGGLRRTLQDAGYRISVYSPDKARAWSYDGADYAKTGRDLASRSTDSLDAVARLAQITAVRVAPNFLRQETFAASGLVLSKVVAPPLEIEGVDAAQNDYRYYKFLSVPLVKRFLDDEAERPDHNQYIYLHVVLPHLPKMWDAECAFDQRNVDPITDYRDQSLCVTKLMGEIVAKLKLLDRYKSSAIVFQSDHGMHLDLGNMGTEPESPTEAVNDQLRATNVYFTPEQYFQRLRALLAIKPPGAAEATFEVSETQTQLADVAATLYGFVNIEGPTTDGISVVSPEATNPREIHVFTGLHFKQPDGDFGVLGRRGAGGLSKLDDIEFAHFSYSTDRGWRVYPNLPVSW
jgi:Sulfatase